MELKGRVCIVTGAAGGVGSALCEEYARNGADIAMFDINKEKIETSAAELAEKYGVQTMPMEVDITSTAAIHAAVEAVEKKFGAIHVLANCAGISIYEPMLVYTEKNWDLSLDLNLKGVFFLSQAVAKNMVKHNVKNGKIVSISSQAGIIGEPGGCAYDASKAGVSMLTQCMAIDLAKHGICCTAVAPGMVNTEMIQSYLHRACKAEGLTKEEFEAMRLEGIPLKRMAEPYEVADLMYFLSSDKANYITGTTVEITGGSCNV